MSLAELARWIGAPGARPWAKAVAIGAGLLLVPLLWWSLLYLTPYRPPRPDHLPPSVAWLVAGVLLLAPLIETAALAAVHWLVASRLGLGRSVFLGVAVVAAIATHVPPSLERSPVIALLFLVFAWQYATWRDGTGRFRLAFGATALTHAVYNFGSLLLAPLWAVLLKA